MAERNKPNELYISRVYDAPVQAVWDAWTDPAQTAQWWGPRGFTLTTHSKDLRVGGSWVYTMHGPDGTDYPNKTIYHEVIPLMKLVYDHGGNDDRPPLFRVTVTFAEVKGKTHMEMTMALPTEEAANETRKFIRKAGGDATWDRLAEFLGYELNEKEKFVINRTFDAPIDVMYEMWTNPEHFKQWLPPTGFEMEFIHADIKSGGSTFYVMTGKTGLKMFGKAQYQRVEKPGIFTYTQQFCDEQGNLSRHPLAPTWPATMLTKITLTAEGSQRTRVTVEWEPYGECPKEEIDTFVKGKPGMTLGWGGSFDKLENYLPVFL